MQYWLTYTLIGQYLRSRPDMRYFGMVLSYTGYRVYYSSGETGTNSLIHGKGKPTHTCSVGADDLYCID